MRRKNVCWVPLLCLLAVLCVASLVACSQKDKGKPEVSGTEPEQESAEWSIGGGSAAFRVIVPNNPPAAVSDAMEVLLSAFEERTGTRPGTGTDYLQKGKLYNNASCEILLGRTKYDQTQTVLSELEDGQYAIRKIGNKIVITAPKDADLAGATEYFAEHFIRSGMTGSNGIYTLAVNDFTSERTVDNMTVTVNGNDIADYQIIYETGRDGYLDIATRLRDKMKDLGYAVSIGRDDRIPQTDGAKEILIGKTNRDLSQSVYADTAPGLLTYRVVISGAYLQIACGGPYSARECVDDMMFRFFGAENKAFADGTYFETDMNLARNAVAEGTDLRIMTANVLAARWSSTYGDICPPVVQRAEIFAATLVSSAPDAVGVQETDADWIQVLPYYLDLIRKTYGIEYKWLFTDYLGRQTLTTVLYRSDKYEAVDSGIENVGWWTSTEYNLRLFEWVYLREKDQPEHRFILSNTHWGFETEAAGAEGAQMCIQLSIDKINWLKATYPGVPIFQTGDYNNNHREDSDYTVKFLAQTGCFDAMLAALADGVRVNDCGGCAGIGSIRLPGMSYIDHIACYGDTVGILKYETLVGKNLYLTDHLPQIADINLW